MSGTPPSALDIARALIAFPSVTPANAGALRYLKGLLDEAGFSSEIVAFSSPGAPTIDNLYARWGSVAPNFVFAGHTDVVPPARSPSGVSIRSPALSQRGVCGAAAQRT